MKKIVCTIIIMLMGLSMLSCAGDNNKAYVEVITSTGRSGIFFSERSEGNARAYGPEYYLEKGETVSMRFVCEECGMDETIELAVPAAKLIHCNCKYHQVDDDTYVCTEYFAITVNEKVTVEETHA